MKKIIHFPMLLLSIFALACGFVWPIRPVSQGAMPIFTASVTAVAVTALPTNTIVATISPTARQVLVRYENARYGYAISHPSSFAVNAISDDYVELGDQITISVSETNPESRVGDAPIVESASSEVVAGQQARVLRGYIGSVGGTIPQQYVSYVFSINGLYYVFTQYALGLHAAEGDISQIVPLNPDDMTLFTYMIQSVVFR